MRVLTLAGLMMLVFPVWAVEPGQQPPADAAPQLARQETVSPSDFLACQQDSDCVLEQSPCGALALNARQRSAYNAYNTANKSQQNCPRQRPRGLPHAVCTQQQCRVLYSDKVTLSPSDKR